MSKKCARWQSLRSDILRIILGEKIEGEARDIYLHITKYECHPVSITHLKHSMHILTTRQRGWVKQMFFNFRYDMPVPDAFGPNYSNRWNLEVQFHYHRKRQLFKIFMKRTAWSHATKTPLFGASTAHHWVSRKDTSVEDLFSDTFIYMLRDKLGVYLTKLKYTPCCLGPRTFGRNTQHLCGTRVFSKGAFCYHCRQVHLKRKFEEI